MSLWNRRIKTVVLKRRWFDKGTFNITIIINRISNNRALGYLSCRKKTAASVMAGIWEQPIDTWRQRASRRPCIFEIIHVLLHRQFPCVADDLYSTTAFRIRHGSLEKIYCWLYFYQDFTTRDTNRCLGKRHRCGTIFIDGLVCVKPFCCILDCYFSTKGNESSLCGMLTLVDAGGNRTDRWFKL